jgi:hypothetical protein
MDLNKHIKAVEECVAEFAKIEQPTLDQSAVLIRSRIHLRALNQCAEAEAFRAGATGEAERLIAEAAASAQQPQKKK